MKQCTRCLESFPATLEFFAQNRKTLNSQCRKCIAEKTKIWNINNAEKSAENKKIYQIKNPELNRLRQIKWKLNNPEIAKEMARSTARKRRSNLKKVLIEKYTELEVLNLYGTNCHLCNLQIDLKAPRSSKFLNWEFGLHIDHLVPISRGGADTLENVRPAHGLCNVKKGAKETTTAVPQLERAMISKTEKR
jgi:5-methylcytosine-specific restriction endonuclease McrA